MKARGQIILEVHFSSEIDNLIFSNVSFMKIRMPSPILPDGEGKSDGQLTKNLMRTKPAHIPVTGASKSLRKDSH